MTLEKGIVYDIETFPNCFTFYMMDLNSDKEAVWEISEFRDDRKQLLEFFQYLSQTQTYMIGFNSINFDYPVIHYLWNNPSASYEQLYAKAMSIIDSENKFGHIIWANERFAPQIDLFKMHHFDNRAKSTSLKMLEINMRLDNVENMPIEVGTMLTKENIEELLIPYNRYDVLATKKFAEYAHNAIEFRFNLVKDFGVDVFNWNDTKIGEQKIIQALGEDVCYSRETGSKKPRQTIRKTIPIKDIILPYVKLENPEFKRIYDFLSSQTLRTAEIKSVGQETTSNITTKGVFTDLTAVVDNVKYNYGVGGIHASVEKKRIYAQGDWIIKDIDVASLYPSIAISNNFYPEHLGSRFVEIYSDLKKEREYLKKTVGKKCTGANSIKLALNGAYGKSNSLFSPMYDPRFTMSITINGQLLLSMLLENLLKIETIKIIQANTDGITYYIHKNFQPQADKVCRDWEKLTGLVLEDADYSRMFIRDVNNYIAIGTDGKRKLKGAYWSPSLQDYHNSIATSQPPAWHKNFSNVVSTRAAVANMIDGIDIETYIKTSFNPYEFCCAVKVRGNDKLFWGNKQLQKNTRYYISNEGGYLTKKMPPKGPEGKYKKANGISDAEYERVMQEVNWQWDERVCTKNKSVYEIRESSLAAGFKTIPVNNIKDFDWDNVNYQWYIEEAKKLLI